MPVRLGPPASKSKVLLNGINKLRNYLFHSTAGSFYNRARHVFDIETRHVFDIEIHGGRTGGRGRITLVPRPWIGSGSYGCIGWSG